MVEMKLNQRPKEQGDIVYIEVGPYKHSTATIIRLTPQKMEVKLHAERFNGAMVMINQTSARVIEPAAGSAQKQPMPRLSRSKNADFKTRNETEERALLDVLEAEMAEMQTKLAAMSLVVTTLKDRARVREVQARR